jgi:hypothetical protein
MPELACRHITYELRSAISEKKSLSIMQNLHRFGYTLLKLLEKQKRIPIVSHR